MKAFREISQVATLSIAVRTSEKSGNKTYFRCKIDLRDADTGGSRGTRTTGGSRWGAPRRCRARTITVSVAGKPLHRSHCVRQGFVAKDKFEDYDGKFG